MIDKFLEVGSGFDWITPLWAFAQDWWNSPAFHINVSVGGGYAPIQIEWALKGKGVKVWGLMVVNQTITFSVRKPQAKYALYWLERWGVQIDGHSRLD